jgi:hypothetical protein
MIIKLMDLIRNFPGEANRTRCFAHIINLVAKSLLRQFDVPNKKADSALDEAEKILLELAEGIDLEEMQMRMEVQVDGEDDDDIDGLVDEVAKLSDDEQERLSESIRPVKLALVKVRFDSTYRL